MEIIDLDSVPFRPGDRVKILENIFVTSKLRDSGITSIGIEATISTVELHYKRRRVNYTVYDLPEDILAKLEDYRKSKATRVSKGTRFTTKPYDKDSSFNVQWEHQLELVKRSGNIPITHKFRYMETVTARIEKENTEELLDVTGEINSVVINKKGRVFYILRMIPELNPEGTKEKLVTNKRRVVNMPNIFYVSREDYIYLPNTLKQRFNND